MIDMPGQGEDRAAKARAALQRKFLDLAGGDRVKADQLRREHYQRLQRRSAAKRRQKRAARVAAENRLLEAQLGEKIMTEDEFVRILQDLGVMR
jgi:hypothetical protein